MERRTFMALASGSLVVAPLAAEAQSAAKAAPLIGILFPFTSPGGSPPFSSSGPLPVDNPLRLGLRDLGYIEGENVRFEYRYSAGHDERFPALAAELVTMKVDVIVAATVTAIRAAQRATTTIPIVMIFSSDPVRLGLVKSLARPGGNATGLASLTFDLAPKRLELFREAIPKLKRVTVLVNPTNPTVREGVSQSEVAGQTLGVRVRTFEVKEPAGLNLGFSAILRERPDGLIVLPDPLLSSQTPRIVEFAAKNRLPAMYGAREFVDAGGLMSYAIDFVEHTRRAGGYIDKILKGANPATLPVEQPTKFEFVINLKTAKALGLTIPPSLLQRADEVIQ